MWKNENFERDWADVEAEMDEKYWNPTFRAPYAQDNCRLSGVSFSETRDDNPGTGCSELEGAGILPPYLADRLLRWSATRAARRKFCRVKHAR